jgi:putative transcriptional regulator
MAKKSSIVLEADPGDPEDFPVDRAALDRAHMGRRIRRLRNRLGLTQECFAERYGIPLSAIRQYEIARTMPPHAVRAYLTVIEREPEMAARALHPDAA